MTQAHPLLKGHGHQSFVLETSSQTSLLLKIALRGEQLGKMKSLRQALELAASHQIPAPRLLHFSEGTASFAGRPWLVQEFLTGLDGEDAWASVVESRLERLTDDHRQAGLLARQRLESATETILSAVRTVSPEVRPALVHRDLYLPNTLVAAGRFRCLLDFEHARSWDAVSDFVKLKMWVFKQFPGSESEFRSGYGSDPLTTKAGRMRYRVGVGLELLSGLLYWTKTGQSAMLADYQTRLGQWLAKAD